LNVNEEHLVEIEYLSEAIGHQHINHGHIKLSEIYENVSGDVTDDILNELIIRVMLQILEIWKCIS
jgi:hypothetical protein